MHITSAEALIRAAADVGVEVYLDDNGTIRIRGDGPPPDDLIQQLRQHKVAIIDHLTARAPPADPRKMMTSPPPAPEPGQARVCQFAALATTIDDLVASRTAEDVTEVKVRHFRRQLDLMPTPANRKLAAIVERSRRLAFEPFVRDAVRLGWCERSLWSFAGLKADDGHGLIIRLAMAPPNTRPTVTRITRSHAEVTVGGNHIRVPRNAGAAAPIWCLEG
jgi:hypothetical protein